MPDEAGFEPRTGDASSDEDALSDAATAGWSVTHNMQNVGSRRTMPDEVSSDEAGFEPRAGDASSDEDALSDAATAGGEDGVQKIAVTLIKGMGGDILCELQVDRDATVGQIVARMVDALGKDEAYRYVEEGWKLVPLLGRDPLRYYLLRDPYKKIMSDIMSDRLVVRRAVQEQDSTMWFQLAGPDCTYVD